jgi:flagellar hook-length control protein FliK
VAWWQSALGANQPATGQVQAMNRLAEGTTATWLQGQGNARAVTGESRQAANQVPAAMAPGANTTGGQPVGKDLGPLTSRMPALADAPAMASATATTGAATASPAARTVPGAANQVVLAGAEAKPTSPNVMPTAAAGETSQTEPASQASQAISHRATTQSLSGMAQQGIVSAVGEKSSAEVDPNLQAQAKLMDRPEQAFKSRSASLLEAGRPVEAHATGPQGLFPGSQHVDSAALASGANTTGGQPAGKDLGPHAPRMSALADAPATVDAPAATGAATATAGTATASPAARTVPGAANQVVPAGTEAKPTSPNVMPTAAAGETSQTEPASQASQVISHRAMTQSLSGMAKQGIVSAVGEKSSAEVDPNLQAQAKLMDRPEQASKSRSASLLEAARPVEANATGQTSFLAGSQHIDSAAQAAPHGTQGVGEQRIAEASRPADQIIENVRQAVANGQREVTINLNPPELGRVRLRMYSEGNEIHGRLEVDNPRTLIEIRHQAELLTQRMVEDGIAIRRLEVHQMSNNGGQTGSFSPQHQDAAWQMPWSHTRHTPAEQMRDRESADGAGAAGARTAASAGESLSAGSLNVWM